MEIKYAVLALILEITTVMVVGNCFKGSQENTQLPLII